jgi:hypothetical protein
MVGVFSMDDALYYASVVFLFPVFVFGVLGAPYLSLYGVCVDVG